MTLRQPTTKEAKRAQEKGIALLARSEIRLLSDGFNYRLRSDGKRGNFSIYKWPRSDISKRCPDCGSVLQDRRDALGLNMTVNMDLDQWRYGHIKGQRDWFCISCSNQRRRFFDRVQEIDSNRRLLGQIRKEIRQCPRPL